MKRSWIKRGKSQMKRSRLKKVSKQKISTIQIKLWQECRRICLKQQADKNGEVHCYTCPARNLQGSNRQLGHVPFPKSTLGAFLKYDLRVLKWQCMRCNQFMGGMGAEAYMRMWEEEGIDFINQLKQDRQITVKAMDFYLELLTKYENL